MRYREDKGRSVGKFKDRASKTHRRNVHGPIRGGIRL